MRAALLDARRRAGDLVADLRAELAGIAESTAAGPDDEHDAEGSTLGYERARVGALLVRAEAGLDGLEAAVRRSEAGDAGRCDGCGGPIAPERLEVLPATAVCIGCARPSGRVRPGGSAGVGTSRVTPQGLAQSDRVESSHRKRDR